MAAKELSPIDVYVLLPKTNCKLCGEENCMAFATKVVNRVVGLELCPPLLEKQHASNLLKLQGMLKPPVKEITLGTGEKAVRIGGKLVMYRHQFAYFNPTAIAVDISDEASNEEIEQRITAVESLSYDYIGQRLKLDMIALRCTSDDAKKFGTVAKNAFERTQLPVMLCSLNPDVLEAALVVMGKARPLMYAATSDNWKEMAELALMYRCPITVSAPGDLAMLSSLSATLLEYGVEDLVLDPGTFPGEGIAKTLDNFTMLRRATCEDGNKVLAYPLMGTPISVWSQEGKTSEVRKWEEAYLMSMLITRYADLIVIHSLDGWSILPNLVLRQNLYTDPRKPVSVDPVLKEFGSPDQMSPLLCTTNFALTYYTVASDVEAAGISCHMLVIDTEGISVESAVAGRKLTAEKVAEAIRTFKALEKVSHKTLIIPGRAARLSGEIEEVTGWRVLVGPMDSSGIPKFLQEKWKPGKNILS